MIHPSRIIRLGNRVCCSSCIRCALAEITALLQFKSTQTCVCLLYTLMSRCWIATNGRHDNHTDTHGDQISRTCCVQLQWTVSTSAMEQAIAHIPLAFVAQGGDNTWNYILEVVRLLVVEEGGWIFADGHLVNAEAMATAATFVYRTSSTADNHQMAETCKLLLFSLGYL